MIRKPLIDQPTQSPHNSFKQKVSTIASISIQATVLDLSRFGFTAPPPQSWTDDDDDHSNKRNYAP